MRYFNHGGYSQAWKFVVSKIIGSKTFLVEDFIWLSGNIQILCSLFLPFLFIWHVGLSNFWNTENSQRKESADYSTLVRIFWGLMLWVLIRRLHQKIPQCGAVMVISLQWDRQLLLSVEPQVCHRYFVNTTCYNERMTGHPTIGPTWCSKFPRSKS